MHTLKTNSWMHKLCIHQSNLDRVPRHPPIIEPFQFIITQKCVCNTVLNVKWAMIEQVQVKVVLGGIKSWLEPHQDIKLAKTRTAAKSNAFFFFYHILRFLCLFPLQATTERGGLKKSNSAILWEARDSHSGSLLSHPW